MLDLWHCTNGWEVQAGGPEIQSLPWIDNESEVSLGYASLKENSNESFVISSGGCSLTI